MVLRQRENKMSSEQPVKKKPKRADANNDADEPDFINSLAENTVQSNLQALHLSLPPHVNEDDITLNTVNLEYRNKAFLAASDSELDKSVSESDHNDSELASSVSTQSDGLPIPPAPNISLSSIVDPSEIHASPSEEIAVSADSSLNEFQQSLIKQCLCGVSDTILSEIHTSRDIILLEWPHNKVLQFLSNLQLLFDVYLKQNNRGFICSQIITNCEMVVFNQYNLIEQIMSLCEIKNKFVQYLAARVLSSFLITAKTNINHEWLETILNILTMDNVSCTKMNFSLDIIQRVVEWKDIDIHVLEEPDNTVINANCVKVPFRDSESYDTSAIKGLIIKSLEAKWPELIHKIQTFIISNHPVGNQTTCILTFLTLWEKIISVKANLSVIDIKPFYAHLEAFVGLLNSNLPPVIWKQLLSLFNEVLCYGSTLALQDMVPDETGRLAHLVVRYVKDYQLLDRLPYRRDHNFTVNNFIGTIPSDDPSETNIDKTLIQKMVLLVLKSVAVTIKEARSDSSDSSIGSDEYDFFEDMQLIVRSIRDVLRKVDAFIKNSSDFHPETPFCKTMVNLFSDQDNYLLESMVCTLDVAVGISYRNAVFPDLTSMLNPYHSFIEFLKIVSHDSDVLLDYLVGNETCFLLYLLRFLKYTRRNWASFVSSCGEGSTARNIELDDTMAVLIRLKMQINRLVARDLFPYNINPILRLLTNCENLYDGSEYS
ncbi:protein lines [Anthonomus grandis grandis]|uniref:protein lines n=1 Tax=Anthonomus grandis grandis TaxID=2921223 RepID=UPI0021661D76|nr:protein lines [Anthonomus grandis grandis]